MGKTPTTGVQHQDAVALRPQDANDLRRGRAEQIVHGYMGWSAGAGLLPIPGLDLVAIIAVKLRMLRDIAALYDVPFRSELAKPLVSALVGGSGSYLLAGPAASMIKTIPLFGSIAGMLALPGVAAAATYATGHVFIRHFSQGGSFYDFDTAAMRKHYSDAFAAAPSRSIATGKGA